MGPPSIRVILHRSSSADDVHQECGNREHQQQVHEEYGRLDYQHDAQPHEEEDDSQFEKHASCLPLRDNLYPLGL